MRSKITRPSVSASERPQNESTVAFEGQAIAVGEDSIASLNASLDIVGKAMLSITRGTSEAKAIARSDPGQTVYTDAAGSFYADDADIIIERTVTTRSVWSDASGDWSATVSTTSYFAIDLYWIDLPQKHVVTSYDLQAAPGGVASVFAGNAASAKAGFTAQADNSLTDVAIDVLTVEDALSSANIVGFASIIA